MFEAGLVLLDEVRAQAGDKFEFLYYGIEVEGQQVNSYFLDKLLGTDDYRLGKKTTQELICAHKPGVEAFTKASAKYRLYE
jgi:acetyl/propionyl-CoA carboxylase alpha subunit